MNILEQLDIDEIEYYGYEINEGCEECGSQTTSVRAGGHLFCSNGCLKRFCDHLADSMGVPRPV